MSGGGGAAARLWLVRHALVEPSARLVMYGDTDVPLCAAALASEVAAHAWLAARLPRPARWYCTPLSRTRATAEAVFAAGYPGQEPTVLPSFREQSLGEWQGLSHEAFTRMLRDPPHPFWPHGADERPPGGESLSDVVARVGPALEAVADENPGGDAVVVAHGGSIRAALAHACRLDAEAALRFSVRNLAVTRLERVGGRHWRVHSVNEVPPDGGPA